MRLPRFTRSCFLAATILLPAGSSLALQADPPASPNSQAGPDSVASLEFDRLAERANQAREAARVEEAISLYQQALRSRPSWDEGWWNLGMLLFSAARPAEARDAFQQLAGHLPKHGPARAMLGISEYQVRDYDRALVDLEKARGLGLGDSPMLVRVAHYHLAILLNQVGRFEEAYNTLKGFVNEGTKEPAVMVALGISSLRMLVLPEEVPAEQRERVNLAGRAAYEMATGKYDEADKLFRELIARYPQMPNVHFAYAVLLVGRRNWEKGTAEFRRELEISPSHVACRLQLAHAYLGQGDGQAALPYAQEAVKLAPELANAHLMLGRVLLATGEVPSAVRELEVGVKLQPEGRELHFQLARAYREAGRKKDAEREAAEFARLDKIQRARQGGLRLDDGPQQAAEPNSQP